MTDHEKFKALLDSVGLDYRSLAEELGFQYSSVKNQLAPAKDLPRWANVLRLGVCYFALQILQVYHNFNRQNNSTKPLLVAGAVN